MNSLKSENSSREPRTAILLGSPSHRDGSPATTQIKRCKKAVEAYLDGEYDVLILTGGETRKGLVESKEMARLIQKFQKPYGISIPMILETNSKNTWQNFENAKKLTDSEDILIITSSSHALRSWLMSKNFFEKARVISAPEYRPKLLLRELGSLGVFLSIEMEKKLQQARKNKKL